MAQASTKVDFHATDLYLPNPEDPRGEDKRVNIVPVYTRSVDPVLDYVEKDPVRIFTSGPPPIRSERLSTMTSSRASRQDSTRQSPELPAQSDKPATKRQMKEAKSKEIAEALKVGGQAMVALAEKYPDVMPRFASLAKSSRTYQMMKPPTMNPRRPDLYWIFGPSGYGKTYHSHVLAAGRETLSSALPEPNQRSWMSPHLDTAQVLIFDNMSERLRLPYDILLKLCEPFQNDFEVKGDYVRPRRLEVIIVTSINHPKDVYGESYGEELRRRLTRLIRAVAARHFVDEAII